MTILTYPNDILRRKAEPVEEITNELVATALEMMRLMKEARGIGLAAPQVGISKQFFVMDTTFDLNVGFKGILFNPKIVEIGKALMPYVEGCLSFPDLRQPTCRHKEVGVEYIDKNKQKVMVRLRGISAICAQHEIDHLNGILFTDYGSK